ncbi:MAG: hypothetical protein NTV70_04690 [Acidobacteria bacterium]|nr:hypothetical protein [Acidobacteriota bacterium]
MQKIKIVSVCVLAVSAIGPAFAQANLNGSPSRVLGGLRPSNTSAAPNLVEGREFSSPNAVALDTSANPPILYVADTGNHRVLVWRDATNGRNGTKADLVIGQRDFTSTTALGPGTTFSSGFSFPTGLAVDRNGSLWVVDSGNNRLLRFPKPLSQPEGEPPLPDAVIGQVNLTSRLANGGQPASTDSGVAFTSGQSFFRASVTLDFQQNVWVADPGNNRVLRFSTTALTAKPFGPLADTVLGQADFVTRAALGVTAANRSVKTGMNAPSGIATDLNGRIYVTDSLARVVVYAAGSASGAPATRIMGVVSTAAGQPAPPTTLVNNISIGITSTGAISSAEGIAVSGGNVYVVDTSNHRILRFSPFEQWPAEGTQFSPTATSVFGQTEFSASRPDGGQPEASGLTFNSPIGLVLNATGDELFVADSSNNRVLRIGGGPSFRNPLQVWGQLAFNYDGVNLIEGREFFFHAGFSAISGVNAQFSTGAGLAFDGNRLYVADPLNNRVLGFRDARAFKNGDTADIVIGQIGFYRALTNQPGNDLNVVSDQGLSRPAGVAVDSDGNLWVTDTGNGRVLRFAKPFDNLPAANAAYRANLVLGQQNFGIKITDASSRNMSAPFGLAFTGDGSLLVSDASHNRVLLFRKPAGADFVNGQAAAIVFGQPDFITTTSAVDNNSRFISPRGLAVDSDDRLYVADAGKGRIVVFDRAPAAFNDATPALSLTGLGSPHGVFVSLTTGEIWATDTAGNRALRYPKFNTLIVNPVPDAAIGSRAPLGVALDRFGNLFLAEAANRVAIYFPGLRFESSASNLPTTFRPSAPNTWAQLKPAGDTQFSDKTVIYTELPNFNPMPTTLNDLQVLLNDTPASLYFVSSGQINFYIPNNAPTSGTMDVIVQRPSTGQVIAAGSLAVAGVSPGLFTNAGTGTGQLAALNEDFSRNGPDNPVQRGKVIALYGSGYGFLSNAPPEGTPAPAGVSTDRPDVILPQGLVPVANIEYFGLAPTLVGVWQINVRIPENTAPGNAVQLSIVLRSVPNNESRAPFSQRTTIAVRQ